MRTKDKTLDLADLNFDRFKNNLKQAIEYFSGSPVKKEAKLFESCAIALGDENSDRLANTLKQTELESANALTLFKAGLCPFTREPLDSDLVKRLGTCVSINDAGDGLIIDCFPEGMRSEDRLIWVASQRKCVIGYNEDEMVYRDETGHAPHLHAAIAGYRKDLSKWFTSLNENNRSFTLCYWHSEDPSFRNLPLATRLQYETHYELVLSFMDNGDIQGLHLYRIFNIGGSWQLSQDASLNLYFDDCKGSGDVMIASNELKAFLALIVEQAVQRPSDWMSKGARLELLNLNSAIKYNITGYFKDYPASPQNRPLEASTLEFIRQSIKTFDYPAMTMSRLKDPVLNPVG